MVIEEADVSWRIVVGTRFSDLMEETPSRQKRGKLAKPAEFAKMVGFTQTKVSRVPMLAVMSRTATARELADALSREYAQGEKGRRSVQAKMTTIGFQDALRLCAIDSRNRGDAGRPITWWLAVDYAVDLWPDVIERQWLRRAHQLDGQADARVANLATFKKK